jgi:hypothetical protein
MMPFDEAALTRKLGPLPAWAWGAGLGGGYLAVRWYRNRNADVTSATDTPTDSTLPDQGFGASGPGGYYDPSLIGGQGGYTFDPSTGTYYPGQGGSCPPDYVLLNGVCQSIATLPAGTPGSTGQTGPRGPAGRPGCDAGYHYDDRKKRCVKNPKCRKGHHWDPKRKKCVHTHSSALTRDSLHGNAATPGARAVGRRPVAELDNGTPLSSGHAAARSAPLSGVAGQDRYQHAAGSSHRPVAAPRAGHAPPPAKRPLHPAARARR